MIQPVESWLRSTPVLMPPGCRLRRYKSPSYPGSEAVPQPLMLSFAQCADRQLFHCAEAPISNAGTDSIGACLSPRCRGRLTFMIRSWSCSAQLLGSALHAVQHVPRHQEISRKYHCPDVCFIVMEARPRPAPLSHLWAPLLQ